MPYIMYIGYGYTGATCTLVHTQMLNSCLLGYRAPEPETRGPGAGHPVLFLKAIKGEKNILLTSVPFYDSEEHVAGQ